MIQLHSIFLHLRKVRRMAGLRDANSTIVRAEWVLNWVAFILARFVSHVLITVKLLRDRHKFGKGIELPLALFGMVGMNLLNVFLGIDLFHAFKREISSQPNSHRHREWQKESLKELFYLIFSIIVIFILHRKFLAKSEI